MMKPVHAMGVFHDANGSMPATVAAADTIMIASPRKMYLFTTEDSEDAEGRFCMVQACHSGETIEADTVYILNQSLYGIYLRVLRVLRGSTYVTLIRYEQPHNAGVPT